MGRADSGKTKFYNTGRVESARGITVIINRVVHCAILFLFMFSVLFATKSSLCAAESEDAGVMKLVSVRPLFNRQVWAKRWTPMVALVRNESNEGAYATLVLNSKGTTNTSRFSRTVWMPGYSEREVVFGMFWDITDDGIDSYFRKKNKLNVKKTKIKFGGGKAVEINKLTPVKSATFPVELYKGKGGGARVGRQEAMASPVYESSKCVLYIDSQDIENTKKAVNNTAGMDFIYGETEEEKSSEAAYSDNVFVNANVPPSELIDGCVVNSFFCKSEYLPANPHMYRGVDVIVLGRVNGVDKKLALTFSQIEALKLWVAKGGALVFSPAANIELYSHPMFREILPVSVLGVEYSNSAPSLEKKFGGKVNLSQQLLVPHVQAVASEGSSVLAETNGAVDLAFKRVGLGSVWFSSYTGRALAGWAKSGWMWAQIMKKRASPVGGSEEYLAEKAPDLMKQIVGVEAPDKKFVVGLLVIYCSLVTFVMIIFRFVGRAEWAWPVMIILSFVGVGLAGWQSMKVRERTGMIQGEISIAVAAESQGEAEVTGYTGVFSPSGVEGKLAFEGDGVFLAGLSSSTSKSPIARTFNIHNYKGFSFNSLDVGGGELFTSRSWGEADVGKGISCSVRYTAAGISGSVKNNSSKDLIDCILVANRRIIQIGTLKAGQEIDIQKLPVSEDGKLSSEDFISSPEAETRARILALSRRMSHKNNSLYNNKEWLYSWPVAFYGWRDSVSAKAVAVEGQKFRSRGMQLVCVPAHVRKAKGAEEFFLQKGICSIRLLDYQARRVYGDVKIEKPSQKTVSKNKSKKKTSKAVTARAKYLKKHKRSMSIKKKKIDPNAVYRPTGWLECEGPNTFSVGFKYPQDFASDNIEVKRVIFTVDINSRNIPVGVSLYDYVKAGKNSGSSRANWKAVKLRDDNTIEVKDFRRFMGKGGELPRIRVRLGGMMGGVASGGLSGLGKWKVRSIDLEVEGKYKK